jgi:hypothetical protein
MEDIDNIAYPRNLNRPTYIVWRFTHRDVGLIAAVFIVLYAPVLLWAGYPVGFSTLLGVAFLLYRGVVVAVKPRGWDAHVIEGLLAPRRLVAGHTLRRIFVLDQVTEKQRWWARLQGGKRDGR